MVYIFSLIDSLFQKKVDPSLEVDVKPTFKSRRNQDDKNRRETMRMRQQEMWLVLIGLINLIKWTGQCAPTTAIIAWRHYRAL